MSNFISIDLEMNQPSGTIIQIGYVIGDLETGELLRTNRIYVTTDEEISSFIQELTGILPRHITEYGVPLTEAVATMHTDMQTYSCFMNPIQWGCGDSRELREQLGVGPDERWIFGRRVTDVKQLFIDYCRANGLKQQSGLKKSCHRMGVRFEGPAHDSLQDALNTWHLYRKLLTKLKDPTVGS